MLRKTMLLISAVLLLGGFTSLPDQLKEQLNTLPQNYSHFDVKMGWDVTTGNGSTIINGVIQNVRFATMEGIEIWVSALDAGGKTVSRSVDYVIPRTLNKGDISSFSVTLPTTATPGTKLLFTYKYSGSDGGGSDGGGDYWIQSFESAVSPHA